MSLIKCPECGHDVSTYADKCIYCGCPMEVIKKLSGRSEIDVLDKEVAHEYILTFVKGRSNNENILCPNCGYQTALMLNSKCDRCGSVIVPKKMHWVLVDKKVSNLSKSK